MHVSLPLMRWLVLTFLWSCCQLCSARTFSLRDFCRFSFLAPLRFQKTKYTYISTYIKIVYMIVILIPLNIEKKENVIVHIKFGAIKSVGFRKWAFSICDKFCLERHFWNEYQVWLSIASDRHRTKGIHGTFKKRKKNYIYIIYNNGTQEKIWQIIFQHSPRNWAVKTSLITVVYLN